MVGETRRKEILKYISESDTPVSGTKLAELFHVSRQVIDVYKRQSQNVLCNRNGY